ncbi:VCAN [Branchiostoma lanceolatum]|uniref:VCAN protein n=1 Tax=Branchiostoma lanceolatum TaxID=7740 RepID=A0A8K0EWP5_BRALA|nr:VCAN [Branchiostoma lanceolatum]
MATTDHSDPHPGPPVEPRYLTIGDHVVEYPQPEEECAYDKPEDVHGYKEEESTYDKPEDVYKAPEEVSLAYKAKDLGECSRKPCQHGRCVNQDGGYKCNCRPGWTGQNCQQVKPCRAGWSGYKNHCYKLTTDAADWETANSRCKLHGANLASITSGDEANFINGIITGAPGGKWGAHLVWFGLHRKDGKFTHFTDGSEVSYTNWEPGEPNNNRHLHIFGRFQGQDCVGMYSKDGKVSGWFFQDKVRRGQWNDDQCYREYPFICKRPK